MISVYAKCGVKRYRLRLHPAEFKRVDNGAAISCGVSADQTMVDKCLKEGRATEVTEEQFQHCGCQSSCKLRGDAECHW